MSEPISEIIIRKVIDKMTDTFGWLNVRRDDQIPQAGLDGDCVIIPEDPEPMEEFPCGFDQFQMRVGIACYATGSVIDESGEHDASLSSVAADIRKAFRADLHLDGIADNIKFEKDQIDHKASPPFALITLNIQFKTLFNDPYSQG